MTVPDAVAARVAVTVLPLAAVLAACGGEASAGGAVGAEAARDTALQRMAEEAVPRVEASAGLEFRSPPRLARSTRERLEAFVASELDDQLPPERAEALTASYARLGLLPDTVDLRALMRSLYLAQVVGYYAPEADTLFVREGVSGAVLMPVLVHELVHALQDQHVDLDSLMAARREVHDAASAARAALEGHATYVMLEDVLQRRTGGALEAGTVDLARLLGGLDLSSLAGMPELSGAPRLVRESLLFPYAGGLAFMQAYWRKRQGRPPPLGDEMPASTEQILHPERFVADARDAPTRVGFPAEASAAWHEVHAGGLGEFEVRLWLSEFLADSSRARRAAAGWDGDRYRLLSTPEGGEVLVWATVWDSRADADEFAAAAEKAFDVRYGSGEDGTGRNPGRRADRARPRTPADGTPGDAGRRIRVRRDRLDDRPVVVLTDAPSGSTAPLPAWTTRVELARAERR